ncbi:acyl-CoA dehydrogenase family protein [Azospirillum doebereinerae]|uniref:acyl-CoA dehydrogenase family protein n=1 Tax=Azospirillum doebereinerae TaxID=92933 RepID=UPI001EE55D0C|nr:acyl-CoA dehydrogenase family protein [Azospirillum doebereinerae]MCG5238185.1 acyl-CoA/acyl-ACP dehydrogenase [Azospirillum doebereinerae]
MQRTPQDGPADWSPLRALVRSDLVPLVDAIDQDGLYPEAALRRFGEVGLFARHVTGDPGAGGLRNAIAGMAAVGETCLSTAFATWCQDACGWYLSNSDNTVLRDSLLPEVASGRQLGGTGLSNPMKAYAGIEPVRLTGERVSGGYVVTGALPWVSNLGDGHVFGAVFSVPGRTGNVMALLRCGQEGVSIAQRSHFCALEGTRTVTVMVKHAFVADGQILADPAEPFLATITPGFILLQAGMALGLIRGAVTAMREADAGQAAINAYLPERPELFEEALAGLEATIAELAATPYRNTPDHMRTLLEARLAAAEWSLRAANAAMLHAGARGYLRNATAQRRLREAYFVAIVTPSIKHLRKELSEIEQGRGSMRLWKAVPAS